MVGAHSHWWLVTTYRHTIGVNSHWWLLAATDHAIGGSSHWWLLTTTDWCLYTHWQLIGVNSHWWLVITTDRCQQPLVACYLPPTADVNSLGHFKWVYYTLIVMCIFKLYEMSCTIDGFWLWLHHADNNIIRKEWSGEFQYIGSVAHVTKDGKTGWCFYWCSIIIQ